MSGSLSWEHNEIHPVKCSSLKDKSFLKKDQAS